MRTGITSSGKHGQRRARCVSMEPASTNGTIVADRLRDHLVVQAVPSAVHEVTVSEQIATISTRSPQS